MNYLLEIGTEELPARLVRGLATELHDKLVERLASEGLAPSGGSDWYATPRRLALLLRDLPAGQDDRSEQVLGPPAHIAFGEDGAPTKAGEGFAKKQGADPAALQRVTTEKGEYAALQLDVKGRRTSEVLAESVPEVVAGLYMAVSMRWGRGQGPFVRAVRWVVSLADGAVLPLELYGVAAGNETLGHRVLGPGPHAVATPDAYLETLRANGVEPDPEERRRSIAADLESAAKEAGAPDGQEFSPVLIEELVMLNENPVVVRGAFDERFLAVPREILDTSMRYHQKMFSLRGEDGALLPVFLTVINNHDPEGTITSGQRQVLEARLHDAEFFWGKDCERQLASFAEELPRVVFQEKLGSYADKLARMADVAEAVATELGFEGDALAPLLKAISFSKVDLCTLTVGEFPELQGVVGALLAREEGEPPEVRCPIRFQYAPFDCPRDDEAPRYVHAMALLDQADTLMGCHGVGLEATGSKDPYGLRRAAYVVSRILAEGRIGGGLELTELLNAVRRAFRSVEGYNGDEAQARTIALLESRLRYHLQEEREIPYDELNAVFAAGWARPADAVARLEALHRVRAAGRLDGLSVPLKRIRNILRDAAKKDIAVGRFSQDHVESQVERDLWSERSSIAEAVQDAIGRGDYEQSLNAMAEIRPTVDRFFDEVLVMAEDPEVRANRLGLLAHVRDLFLQIADIGEIVESSE